MMPCHRIVQIYLLAALLIACLCAGALAQTNTPQTVEIIPLAELDALNVMPTTDSAVGFAQLKDGSVVSTNPPPAAAREVWSICLRQQCPHCGESYVCEVSILATNLPAVMLKIPVETTDDLSASWTPGTITNVVRAADPQRYYRLDKSRGLGIAPVNPAAATTNQPPITNAVSAPVAMPPIPGE